MIDQTIQNPPKHAPRRSVQLVRITRLLVVGVCLMMTHPAFGDEIQESFRDSQLNQMAFGVVGDRALMQPSADGLRIASTADSRGNTGLQIPQEIYGDFQFDAEVRLNDFPVPKDGYGTGVAILLEDAVSHGASIQLVIVPSGKRTLVAHDFVIVAGQHQHRAQTFPMPSAEVSLRLERRGSTLHYSVSADHGVTFNQLHQTKFASTPIRVAQVYGQAGGENNVYDVVLQSVNLTADELVRPGQRPKTVNNSRLTTVVTIVCLLTLIAVIMVRLVLRNRRPAFDETT